MTMIEPLVSVDYSIVIHGPGRLLTNTGKRTTNDMQNVFGNRMISIGLFILAVIYAATATAQTIGFEQGLENSIEFAMNSLELVSVDPDQNGEAYHGFYLHPDGHLELAHALEIGVPHMTGRSVDALLFGEEVLGRTVDEVVLERLTFHLLDSFDNAHHINAYVKDGADHIEFHNLREGLHGLAALIKYRNNAQAAIDGHEMLVALDAITAADGSLSSTLISQQGKTDFYHGWKGFAPGNSGRFVGALIKYYRETSDPLALELAEKYALHCLDVTFDDQGELTYSLAHVHSVTSALSSILIWALELQKINNPDDLSTIQLSDGRTLAQVVEKCRKAFFNAFDVELSSTFGWFKEERNPGTTRGEMNQVGDMIQAALFLGQLGRPEDYEYAERYMRSFVLPVQLLGVSAFQEDPDATEDRFKNIRRRAHGCFGFPMPNDRFDEAGVHAISATDVTAGTLQAICEFVKTIVFSEGDQITLNLLFDVQTPEVNVVSDLPETGRIRLTPTAEGTLRVRIPSWVARDQIALSVGGVAQAVQMQEPFLVAAAGAAQTVEVTFPLRELTETETVADRQYTVTWKGDQVTALEPVGATQPLYQASPPPTQVWGRVTDAETGLGMDLVDVRIVDSGAQVLAHNESRWGGHYAIDIADLPSGAYDIQAEYPGSTPIVRRGVALETGRPETVDFELTLKPTLSGRLTNSLTGDAVADGQVSIYEGATLISSTPSQSDGRYFFCRDYATGDYRVEAVAEGYLAVSAEGIHLQADKPGSLDFRLAPDETYNHMSNPGWDVSTGAVTLGVDEALQFDNGNAIADWQVYALGGASGATATFSAEASAEAISGPNLMAFTKGPIAPGDAAIRKETPSMPVLPDNVYKTGFWVRDVDASLNSVAYATTTFPSVTVDHAMGSIRATSDWERVEVLFLVPEGDSLAGLGLRMGEPTGSLQLDSTFIYNVTAGNRLTNAGFENSPTRLLEWDTFAVGGRSVVAELSAESVSGNHALRLSQTNTSGDGGISRDGHRTPWQAGQGFRLSLKLKDDPALATGEYVVIRVCAFNAEGQVVGCPLDVRHPAGAGAWAAYEETAESVPAGTVSLSLSLRVVNASGGAVAGDVLVDDVDLRVIGQGEGGYTPSRHWQLYVRETSMEHFFGCERFSKG